MADTFWSFAAGAATATAVGCCAVHKSKTPSDPVQKSSVQSPQDGRCTALSDHELFKLFDRFESTVRRRYPTRVVLVRHGESEGNVDLDIYRTKPDAALRLTPKGRAQAVEAGKKLKADIGDSKVHFIVSPYTRTRETLHGILQAFDDPTQINAIVEDPRIREQEFGMYQVCAWLCVAFFFCGRRLKTLSRILHRTLRRCLVSCEKDARLERSTTASQMVSLVLMFTTESTISLSMFIGCSADHHMFVAPTAEPTSSLGQIGMAGNSVETVGPKAQPSHSVPRLRNPRRREYPRWKGLDRDSLLQCVVVSTGKPMTPLRLCLIFC